MGKLWKKSRSGREASGGAAKEVAGSPEGSDISLMSEESDWEAERAALRANLAAASSGNAVAAPVDPFEHASLWAEVDRDELERMALNIARNTVPPAPAGEGAAADAAARLNVAAAVAERAEEHDSTDPLGHGRIDTRSLTLAKGGSGAAYKQRYSRASGSGVLDGMGRRPWAAGRVGEEGGGGSEAPPALRARVLPGSQQFDPQQYLGTIHAETTLPDLVRGLAALRSQLSEHTGQLKALVKENFDRFISSKNTIDTVYAKLQKAEAEGEAGVHGASTGEVMESVLQVQGEAQRTFGPLLDRQAKADRIRLVLGVMRRYEALLALPSRVRQHAEAGDYEQVVADYRKAKALLADQAPPPTSIVAAALTGQQMQSQPDGGMWAKLMDEIDKVVSSVAHSLDAAVRSVQSSPAEAHDAIRHLLKLRAVGVPAASQMDPISAYIEAQERHVRSMLEGRLAQHTAQLAGLRRQQQESAELEAQAASLASLGVGGSPTIATIAPPATAAAAAAAAAAGACGRSGGPSPTASRPPSAAPTPRGGGSCQALPAAMEAAAVRYVSLITAGLCQWLPDYWAITQQRLRGLASIGDAAPAVERGMAAAERSVAQLLRLYRDAVQTVLGDPAAAGLSHSGLLSIATELAACCEELQAAPAGGASGVAAPPPPPAAMECLQQLAEQALVGSLGQMAAHLSAAASALCAAEDFRFTFASRRTGAPATASVAGLQQLVQQGMRHLQVALEVAAQADVQPLRTSAVAARDTFFACFSSFAAGTDALAASLLRDVAAGGGAAGAPAGNNQSLAAEAAAASAAVAASAAAATGGKEPAGLSPTRRLLVLCANLGAVRSRLLPQQFGRWASLLQAGGGGKELQAAAQACAAELEAVETRLASAYIDRKQAVLDEVMEQLLFTDGTLWEAAPPPTGLRPVALDLVHTLVAVQAELASTAPALLGEAMEELLLGTLDGWAQVLAQGGPAASPGGVLQLWLEGGFVLAAVAGLRSDSLVQASNRLRTALDARLEETVAAVVAQGAAQAAALAAWAAGGSTPQTLSAAACRQRLEGLMDQAQAVARSNLASLQLATSPR